jgi:hypothetical protein
MILHAAVLATLLSGTPFPAPRVTPVSDRLKCDLGKVLSVEPTKGELSVMTTAGAVHYKAGGDVQVFDRAGQPIGGVARLLPGQKVRVYYVVAEGAIVSEITLE